MQALFWDMIILCKLHINIYIQIHIQSLSGSWHTPCYAGGCKSLYAFAVVSELRGPRFSKEGPAEDWPITEVRNAFTAGDQHHGNQCGP